MVKKKENEKKKWGRLCMLKQNIKQKMFQFSVFAIKFTKIPMGKKKLKTMKTKIHNYTTYIWYTIAIAIANALTIIPHVDTNIHSCIECISVLVVGLGK